MATFYDLNRAHPAYRPMITTVLDALSDKYQRADLRQVSIVAPRSEDDHSMASAGDGAITLNGYWFERHPRYLQEAAKTPPLFHGRMTMEPLHVLSHEFGHILQAAIPGSVERAEEAWTQATRNIEEVSAAYGLCNQQEFFAETFAAVELGMATIFERDALDYMMGRI